MSASDRERKRKGYSQPETNAIRRKERIHNAAVRRRKTSLHANAIARRNAAKYPRDPGARAVLKGKAKSKAERQAKRANGVSQRSLERFDQGQRNKAVVELMLGKRRTSDVAARNWHAPLKAPDIRDLTVSTAPERAAVRKHLSEQGDGFDLLDIPRSVGKGLAALGERYGGTAQLAGGPATPKLRKSSFATADPQIGAAAAADDVTHLLRAFAYEIPKAYLDDPVGMVGKDASLIKDSVYGAIPAITQIAADPKSLYQSRERSGPGGKKVKVPSVVDALAKDYKHRYGDVVGGKPDWGKFQETVRETGGLSYGLDLPLPSAAAGKGIGILAKAGGKAGLFPSAAAAVRAQRSLLRYGNAPEEVVRQFDETRKRTPNAFRAMGQKSADSRRTKKNIKAWQDFEAGKGPRPLATGKGEVAATPRQAKHLMRKAARQESGRIRAALHAEQADKLAGISHAIAGLNKHEERGLKYIMEGTVNPDAPAADLAERLAHIGKGREAAGTKLTRFSYDETKNIQKILENPEKVFTPRVRQIAEDAKDILADLETRDPALTGLQGDLRRFAKPAELLGIKSPRTARAEAQQLLTKLEREHQRLSSESRKGGTDPERAAAVEERLNGIEDQMGKVARVANKKVSPDDDLHYVAAVETAMQDKGWGRPGYFPSHRFDVPGFAERAAGGTRATHDTKQYRGRLFRTGQERHDPQLLVSAMARSIKRDVQWNSVTDDLLSHADLELSSKNGTSIYQLKKNAEDQGKNLDDYVIISPNKAREDFLAQRKVGDATPNRDFGFEQGHEADPFDLEDSTGDNIAEALKAGTLSVKDANKPGFENVRAYAFPKEYANERLPEIIGNTKQAKFRAWGRKYDVSKSTISRGMFFLNVPWVLANVAGNAIIAGVSPANYVKARRWFNSLDPELKKIIEPDIQVASRMQDLYKPSLGASGGPLTDAYRAIRQTPLGSKRPLKGMVDRWMHLEQKVANEPFFLAKVYQEMKNDPHFKDLDKHAGEANQAMEHLSDIVKLPKAQQAAAFKANKIHFQHYVDNMHKALGDFTSLGTVERATVGRVMFYPWIRFSLRWTFYTMPKDHPVLTATAMRLAQLHRDELEEIYGQEVPAWMLSKFTAFGQEFDARRFNPTGNVISEMRDPGNLLSTAFQAVSPAINTAAALAGGVRAEEGFRQTTGTKGNVIADPIGNARLALADALGIAYPTRQVSQILSKGKQKDTSLFGDSPREYARNPWKDFQKRQVALDSKDKSAYDFLLSQLGILSSPDRSKLSIERSDAFPKDALGRPKKKKKKSGGGQSGFGAGGFGGSSGGFGTGGF